MKCHSYIFFSTRPALYDVSPGEQQSYKKGFLDILAKEKDVVSYTYATLGLKPQTNIMIWFQSETIEAIQDVLNKLLHTQLGKYLEITRTLFGMTRPTQYSSHSTTHLHSERKGGKYLIIYPFTKTTEWYMQDYEKRKQLMGGHVLVGKKYPEIEQVLLYSYGIDDSEFIVSYEADDLSTFQSLVMDLRSDKVREYTLKDTPLFTCIYKSPQEALNYL